VALLRRLWEERSVTFDGAYDHVTGAGLAPLPVQRPIPIWFGAFAPAACRRAGRLGDGWFPMVAPGPRLDGAIAEVRRGAIEAGRDPDALGMEAQLQWRGDPDQLAVWAERWRDAGATHAGVNTMGAELGGVDGHLRALALAAKALGLQ
jgi:alkanesulfonate monooxygenase SsuD/methylene tetrahydromethanopterin reductase-like flavin-dependent oxidoreductase (luciferase family)